METLGRISRALRNLYERTQIYTDGAGRAILTFLLLEGILYRWPHWPFPAGTATALLAALLAALLPVGFIPLAGAAFAVTDLTAYAPAAGITGGLLILTLLLIFAAFSHRTGAKLSGSALLCGAGFTGPAMMAIPQLAGTGGTLSVLGGIFAAHTVRTLFAADAAATGIEEMAVMLPKLLGQVLLSADLVLDLVTGAAVCLVITLISHLSIRYAPYLAACCAVPVYIVLRLVRLLLPEPVSVPNTIFNAVVGLIAGLIICICTFTPDYRGTKYLLFEDDDYYYSVKMVPKAGRKEEGR